MWMLYIINLIDAELYRAFRVNLLVSSGIRTYEEQVAIFRSRYVRAADVNGRRVYDTRWWNGVLWYRISSAGTVAQPGTSNHEIQGNKAAVDIRDTGDSAGVTVASSLRGRWLRQNAWRWGLVASGDGFGEGWHFDVLNIFNTPPSPSPDPAPTPPLPEPTLEELMAFQNIQLSVQKAANVDSYNSTAFDFEDGMTTSLSDTAWKYTDTFAKGLTGQGGMIVSQGHFDLVKRDFENHMKRRHEKALEVARASAPVIRS
jgi:hypothetical protein